jgi:glycine/D-amino acid oxidase-like deaminating enzyme
MTRRDLLLLGAGLMTGCGTRTAKQITGSFVGASYEIGHLLRGGKIPLPSRERRVPVIIVGGGVAGLSAAWQLARHGCRDFEILELENEAGGNARFGENRVSAYPWGAHYVPLPTRESRFVRELFEELGVITGYANGEPIYKDEYLCFDPQERLYIHGRWQEGLVPTLGTTDRDRDDFERFKHIVAEYKSRQAFTIPMEFSAQEKDLIALDSISIKDFLNRMGLNSPALHWYVNYACRDDYGCKYADVSAWAGMHYFASRDVDESAVLTWPEGNGWIVKRLRDKLSDHVRQGALVFRVSQTGVDFYDVHEKTSTRIRADHIIFACPTYLAKYLIENPPRVDDFEYAPWLVANLTLDSFPKERAGAPIAWDNVIYDSDSLGYVVATHQNLRTYQPQTVFTFYHPLTGSSPATERTRLLNTGWHTWVEFILSDLSKPHPEIRDLVRNLDIMRWGHAMVRPKPGFIWGDARDKLTQPFGRIHFAHSDLSGFSIFEEAQYRGVTAANWVLKKSGSRTPEAFQ